MQIKVYNSFNNQHQKDEISMEYTTLASLNLPFILDYQLSLIVLGTH